MKSPLLYWLLFGVACLAFWACLFHVACAQPAFPGAEGYGQNAIGGRGGRVIKCTTASQFKKACQDSTGARIVIVTSGGYLDFGSQAGKITVTHRYLTVAGQCSAGDGLFLKNLTLTLSCPEIIIRNVHIARGDSLITGTKPEGGDCITIGSDTAYNIIIDHCTIPWGTDENLSCGDGAGLVTVSWCMIYQPLALNCHPEGEHSKTLMWHNSSGDSVSYTHNSLVHSLDRNAQMVGPGNSDFIGNVIYNYGIATTYGQDSIPTRLQFKRNYFRWGLDTPLSDSTVVLRASNNPTGSLVYAEDNFGFRCKPCSGNQWGVTNESTVFQSTGELAASQVTAQLADSFQYVVDHAGAFPRTTADTKMVTDFAAGTGRVINGISAQTVYYPLGTITTFTRGVKDTVIISLTGDVPVNRYTSTYNSGTFIEVSGIQTNTINASTVGVNGGSGLIKLIFNTPFTTTLTSGVTTYKIQQDIVAPVSDGWPTFSSGTALTDTDNDGLPDVWELYFGGTTTSITQSDAMPGLGGYTYMDVYMYTCMSQRIAGLSIAPRYSLR